jgi:putative ABC transport system permease protein
MGMETFLKHGGFVWLKGDPEKTRPMLLRGRVDLGSLCHAHRSGHRYVPPDRGLAGGTAGGGDRSRLSHERWGGLQSGRLASASTTPSGAGEVLFQGSRIGCRCPGGETAQAIIARWGDQLDLVIGKDLREAVLRIFDETFVITTVLLLIALVVAALGITTTLTVLVLERARQLNTVFAVGGSFRQIRSMIFWEASFLVVAGEVAGLICGFILSFMLVYVINRRSFGWTFLYTVDWGSLAYSLPLIILTALFAAAPAVRMCSGAAGDPAARTVMAKPKARFFCVALHAAYTAAYCKYASFCGIRAPLNSGFGLGHHWSEIWFGFNH